MTQAVFFQPFDQLPEAMKQELLAFFEYLAYKYKISQTKPAQTKIENDNEPQGKAPKAGFLKGTFVMADDFDEPLDDFKEYM